MLLPGGWLKAPDMSTHPAVYVLHRRKHTFELAVCTTGDGLQYHPCRVDKSPQILYKRALVGMCC